MNDSRGIEIVNFTISLALSAGTLMASAGTPYRLVLAHFLPLFIYLRAHGLRKGDEHPAYTPYGVRRTYGTVFSVDFYPEFVRKPVVTAPKRQAAAVGD